MVMRAIKKKTWQLYSQNRDDGKVFLGMVLDE